MVEGESHCRQDLSICRKHTLSHSSVFPTPPAALQKTLALPTEMDSVGLAISRQLMQERHVQAVIMSGVETKLEDGHNGRRLEEVARQGRKVRSRQTKWCLLSGSITKRMEQTVCQEMKMLPGLVSKGM